jgi:lycopene beta-cyclase
MKAYDYIIIGAGCAGLSLLMRIMDTDTLGKKKILLIDKAAKNSNDRTWCFWERGNGYFEDIVYRKWNHLFFKNEGFSKQLDMGDYAYKMIRGIDFYNYCFERIKSFSNIEIKYVDVTDVGFSNRKCTINSSEEVFVAQSNYVFSSVFKNNNIKSNEWFLLQHFKGWVIETGKNVFNQNEARFMDFSMPQQHEAAFVYMLPVSERKALIEYTVFSKEVLPQEEYDVRLKNYIQQQLQIKQYSVTETEFGIIPMTNHRFPFLKNGIYYIGTAGGQTKASTGYTFQFIQKQVDSISKALEKGADSVKNCDTASRFHLYDSILLRVLCQRSMKGVDIFSRLFTAVPASMIFKFLDNETTIIEEMKILNSMPFAVFTPAALKEIVRLFR